LVAGDGFEPPTSRL